MKKLPVLLAFASLFLFAPLALAQDNLLTNTAFESPNAQNVPKGWQLVKNVKEGAESGEVTLAIVQVPPPPDSPAAKSENPPATVPALAYSIDEALNWAYIAQRSAETQIPAGKKYRFTAWIKSDKPAKVCVILSFLGKAPEGGGKLPEQTRWNNQELSSDWKLYSTDLTANDAGPYLFFWPRVQLYTPGATVTMTFPMLEVVEE
ncbi:MAG: hypothetical protein V2A58_17920 [Planctomycetota bacterium]